MARFPRIHIPNVPLHIVQRGNNRQVCFFHDADRAFYMARLEKAANENDVAIHAFVLMTNHVHLLASPRQEGGASKMMQALGRNYVRYFNTRYQRTGTLWEGRFKSSLVQSSQYLLQVYRYIELNPVRAGIVDKPEEYQWTSYHHNAGEKSISLLTPHHEYLNLGNNDRTRKENYKSLFQQPLACQITTLIRESINKSKVYGSESFKQEMSNRLRVPVEPQKHGGDRRSGQYQGL